MANNKSEEKKLAFELYINTNLTQKEIASRVGVTEKTISSWANEENWESVKDAKNSSSAETIAGLKELLKLQTEENKKKIKDGTFGKNDADTLLEISRTIKTLEGDDAVPFKVYIKIMEEFMDSIPADNKIRIPLADLQMQFLLSKTPSNS